VHDDQNVELAFTSYETADGKKLLRLYHQLRWKRLESGHCHGESRAQRDSCSRFDDRSFHWPSQKSQRLFDSVWIGLCASGGRDECIRMACYNSASGLISYGCPSGTLSFALDGNPSAHRRR
jgi:hypothetical protein